jgi:putative endonuclease
LSKPTNKTASKSPKRLAAKNAGLEGEKFVAELLKANSWEIVATQWRCYWGELDIVARDRTWLVFVEVKTRSANNWDENGLLAIAPSKQQKLWKAATEFLTCHPDLARLPCRFDVALVKNSPPNHLELHDYLESAFSL